MRGAHGPGARRKSTMSPASKPSIAEAAATWTDRLRAVLIARNGERGRASCSRAAIARAFPPAYQADVAPAHALEDIADLEALRARTARRCGSTCTRPAGQQRRGACS